MQETLHDSSKMTTSPLKFASDLAKHAIELYFFMHSLTPSLARLACARSTPACASWRRRFCHSSPIKANCRSLFAYRINYAERGKAVSPSCATQAGCSRDCIESLKKVKAVQHKVRRLQMRIAKAVQFAGVISQENEMGCGSRVTTGLLPPGQPIEMFEPYDEKPLCTVLRRDRSASLVADPIHF